MYWRKMSFYPMIVTALCGFMSLVPSAQTYRSEKGMVHFASSAKLERVEARSNELKGALDLGKQSFAFSVEINSFTGFNSDLQREHFRENYLESEQFPKATFMGKLIDPVDIQKSVQKIRAKGTLTIHGLSKERIIDVELSKVGDGYKIQSQFNVSLDEHNIVIPKLVYQKIAEVIAVQVESVVKL
jgi:polyisoprenoid-binding protein YceI